MKIEYKAERERLDFFRALYADALSAYAEELTSLERCMKQYRGTDEIDGSDTRAITVRNITYEIVESQVLSDIPMPKADPASYSVRRSRNAESIERLCRSLRDRLPFEEFNDIDERYTYIYGGSVWYAEWDNSTEYDGEVGGVRVHCISPRDFLPQPGIHKIEDMEYCFLRFTTTRGELSRKYGVDGEEAALADLEYEWGGEGDAVTLTLCFYRDEDGDIGRFIFSGELTLSDMPKYYMRKGRVCSVCGSEAGLCSCVGAHTLTKNLTYELIPEDIILGDGATLPADAPSLDGDKIKMGRSRIPYYVPRSFPIVIRKNTSGEKSLFGQSDCDYIRPEQQAINKIESRILAKLLRSGITPIMPEDASVTLNNSVFGQVIKMKPGESAAQYGTVDTTPDISQDIAEAERLYDHAKRIIGISDAYQGVDTHKSESGYARQLRISQASGRLESKKRMKHTAYAALDKIIFGLYLAFADEPRKLAYRDAFGTVHPTEFNRYDFIEYDLYRGEFFYDDGYLFSVDQNGGAEYQREALWERNLENLKAGTLGNPESPATLLRYWQSQERAHYPYARENVEYFSRALEEKGVDISYEENEFKP
ncbi:MAG: hypothetical protein IKA64_00495 [Clostridia bacterium]|nr:hypothetical protein [Clostridia bacterium]